MRQPLTLASCVAAAVLMLPATVSAQDTFSIPLIVDFENDAFDEFHRYAAERVEGRLVDGALVVDADSEPGNCRFATSDLGGEGTRATFVDLDADAPVDDSGDGRLRGAGVMVKFGSGEGTRFLAMLVNGDAIDVVAFVDGAVPQRIGSSTGEPLERPVMLAARETGGGAEFFLNGERIASLSDSQVSGRALGLIHCGSGRFVFDNWGQNRTGDIDGPREAVAKTPDPGRADVDETVSATPPIVGGPPPVPRAEWFVESDGAPLGPITLRELRDRLSDGRSAATSLVWREGMADWTPAQEALD